MRNLLFVPLMIASLAGASAAPMAVPAPDQTAIRAFLTAVYSSYKECKASMAKCADPMDRKSVFTPGTLSLIATNVKLNQGEVGAATGSDPVCGCQDHGTIKVNSITLTPSADGRVLAKVRFTNFGPVTASLVMEKTAGGWRVHDVLGESPSYRGAIIAENQALARPATKGR